MKIAQIAPLMESVPPRLYGGTERVVAYLTEELINQGHDVTLFASGDSVTSADFVPCCTSALRLDAATQDPIPYYITMLDKVTQVADTFDILHFHIDYLHFPLLRGLKGRAVTTLHGRRSIPTFALLLSSRSPTRSVSRSPGRISWRPCIMAYPLICIAPSTIRKAATSLFSAASRPRKIRSRPSASPAP
jgi:glycosyltransferase involved in cell wall biosynthesis